MQPTSWSETVPVMAKASQAVAAAWDCLCGKLHGNSCGGLTQVGCQTVTRTSYTPVPVVRNVVETTMVTETHSRQVEVKTCRMITEQKVETVPIKVCRMVPEIRTVEVPVTRMKCVPKTVTRMVPVCSKEVVPVTCYKPVKRMVPELPGTGDDDSGCRPLSLRPVDARGFWPILGRRPGFDSEPAAYSREVNH